MAEPLAIQCPHCGEQFSLAFDATEGDSEFIIDCEVCCRPMTVTVQMESGEINQIQVSAA